VKITGYQTYGTFVGAGGEKNDDTYRDGTGVNVDFAYPYSIAIDNDGYMFVSEIGNNCNRIRYITPSGKVTTLAAGDADTHNALLPKFENNPMGLAISPDGRTLYVAEGNRVWKIELTYN
jgi:DNA-binding beta-propeller fold protein YncE